MALPRRVVKLTIVSWVVCRVRWHEAQINDRHISQDITPSQRLCVAWCEEVSSMVWYHSMVRYTKFVCIEMMGVRKKKYRKSNEGSVLPLQDFSL